MVTGCQQRFLNDPKKGGNNQKEKKGRKERKQSSDINISIINIGSNHANLIQPNSRPHQLGIAQIIAFNTHIERYNDTGIAHFWYAAVITK